MIAGSVNGSELGGNLSAAEARWGGCCIRSPWNLPSAYKYDWMMGVSASSRRSDKSWLGLLADTDILFQCTASELRARFEAFGTPLVIGGERSWFPPPVRATDPFGPPLDLGRSARRKRMTRAMYYPNGGILVGTDAGYRELMTSLRRNTHFPCCSYEDEPRGFRLAPCNSCNPRRTFSAPVPCVVDDQACLSVALSSRAAPSHAIDKHASLVLSLHSLSPGDVALRGGRVAFRPTGNVPCILHGNGFHGVLSLLRTQLNSSITPWAVSRRRSPRGLVNGRASVVSGLPVWDRKLPLRLPALPVESSTFSTE